ncbi:hypothetical protein PG997_006373 [Apiospora hydei]|uniref:Uncharacterized protein n=1 Tax=Apiospora hydei TaxID=1337664 RepID=A0ABR1WQ06_9PEZI
MCRRTIIHHMHHDVRTAITLSTQVDDGQAAPLYVHPYRTTKHTCDINVAQSLAHIGLRMEAAGEDTEEAGGEAAAPLRVPQLLRVPVRRQAVRPLPINVDAVEDLAEPEECADFLLEHRHAPLNVQKLIWNQWARVVDRLGDNGSGTVVGLPTALAANPHQQQQKQGPSLPKLPEAPKWRDLEYVTFGESWRPVFRRDRDMYLGWSVWMFDRLVELQTAREEDARAVAELRRRGLAGGFALMDRMATTSADVRAAEGFIRNEYLWAATPPH